MFEDEYDLDLTAFFGAGPDAVKLFTYVLLQQLKRGGAGAIFSEMKLNKDGASLLLRHIDYPDAYTFVGVYPETIRVEVQEPDEEPLPEEVAEEILDTISGELETARMEALKALQGGPTINIRKRKRNNTNKNNRNMNGAPSGSRIRTRKTRKTRRARKSRRSSR